MNKPNLKKLPRRYNLFMIITIGGIVICFFAYKYIANRDEIPAVAKIAQTGAEQAQNTIGIGGAGSPEYNTLLEKDNAEKARMASESGRSFIPSPIGGGSLLEKTAADSPATGENPAPKTVVSRTAYNDPNRDKRLAALTAYLTELRQAAQVRPAPEMFIWPTVRNETTVTQASPEQEKTGGLRELVPGTILYAVNQLTVSSDTPGAPVLASVVHGPLKGAKALGKFQLSGERLVVLFSSLSLNGQTYKINGYAIDPDTSHASVASQINRHTFIRWTSFLAASFLEGLGEALSQSGTSRVMNSYETWTFHDAYSPSEQAMMAAGKVGERAADHLEKKLDMPPTVTFSAGTALGILIAE